MNTSLTILVPDRFISIGGTGIPGITTDLSWIPSDVWAVQWNGSTGHIEYNDGKNNLGITSIGIYSQAQTSYDNELSCIANDPNSYDNNVTYQWEVLRNERDDLLLMSDFSQLEDVGFTTSKKAEWIAYRKSLRDMPSNTSNPKNPTWPTKPS
tara:strand:- start:44 stop:502 length:459 start_codon:yes stop_codon:yes gene_type:complete